MRRFSLTEISPGSAVPAFPLPTSYGADQYYAAGYEKRERGHHPPKKPISAYEKLVIAEYQKIKDRWYTRSDVPSALMDDLRSANEGVVTSLRNDEPIGGIFGISTYSYHDCLKWRRGDAGALDRWNFKAECGDWQDSLAYAETRREAALQAVRDWAMTQGNQAVADQAASDAETSGSFADWSKTGTEQADAVVGPGILGEQLLFKPSASAFPTWAKWLLVGGGTLLVARILFPPLFATWLARPKRSSRPDMGSDEELEM